MFKIIKEGNQWLIRNNVSGKSRLLKEEEVEKLMKEFPNLVQSRSVCFFRNRIETIAELPS